MKTVEHQSVTAVEQGSQIGIPFVLIDFCMINIVQHCLICLLPERLVDYVALRAWCLNIQKVAS